MWFLLVYAFNHVHKKASTLDQHMSIQSVHHKRQQYSGIFYVIWVYYIYPYSLKYVYTPM